eukprot:jgi/Galph1/2020/GphlegSOOS_G671.1
MQTTAETAPQGFVYYFAFGANMNPKVYGKTADARYEGRQSDYVHAQPARLRGYEMVFNLRGFAGGEPCFGNLEECKDGEVHGVCFCITQDALKSLHQSEFPYKLISVVIETYSGRQRWAKALQAYSEKDIERCSGCSLPSKRYRDLVLEGCKYWKLDPSYIQKIENKHYLQPTKFHTFLSRSFLWTVQVAFSKLRFPMWCRKYFYFCISRLSWFLMDLILLVHHAHYQSPT